MTKPPAPQNILDKAIAYLSPGAALRRMQQRGLLAVAGGYTGARVDRAQLAAWKTRAGSPESDLSPDLPKLRERSRDLARNAPVATGAIGTTVTHVIGTGLACMPQIDREFLGLTEEQAAAWQRDVSRRFKAWAASPDCHLERVLDFYAQQELVFRSVLESGDILTITPRVARQGKPPRLALQHIEADRICNPQGKTNTDTLTDGVEHSAETGEAIRYHVMRGHPGDLRSTAREWTPIAARGSATGRRNALHLFRPTRPGQRRGAPMLAPIIEPLKQLGRYTDAELTAAVTSGLFSVFLRMDPQAFQDLFDDNAQQTYLDRASNWSGDMEAGKAVNLLPGEEPVTSNPGRPNAQFDPFTQSILKQIGMALGMPYEVLTMAYQSSYSAARGALLMAWKFFMTWRNWMATSFCQPIYELWLSDEVAAARVSAPGFFADDVIRHAWCGAQWVGDGPGSIDPGKEVDAAQKRVDMGISTLQAESILHDGVDWETKHAQQVKEQRARREAGLGEPPAAAAPTEEPPADEEDRPDANTTAIAAALDRLADMRAGDVIVHQAPVTVTAPAVSYQAGDTHVHMGEGMVQLEATVEQPAIHVPPAPPAQVVVQQSAPALTRQVVRYNAAGDVAEIVQAPIDGGGE
jgi:lambda family phage portal protein